MEFRFRKYIDPKDYHSTWKSGGMPTHPAFKTGSGSDMYNHATTGYNKATGSGVLKKNSEVGWDGAIVLSVTPTSRELQDYFKRTWIEEDGIDVYLDGERKHKATKNTIEMLIKGEEYAVRTNFEAIIDKINEHGVFEFYDTYSKSLKRLILDKVSIIKEMSRHGMRVIHFKLECTNVLGYDIKNFNPTTGTN